MPRKSKQEREAEALAQAVAEAIANLPFAPNREADDARSFANLPADVQAGVARAIYVAFRIERKSGKACRALFGGTDDAVHGTEVGLSGHRRRDVLRHFGYADGVARSYDAYSDGEPRKGSAHARSHGAAAEERAAVLAQELAERDAAEAKRVARNARAAERRAAKKANPNDAPERAFVRTIEPADDAPQS